MIISEADAQHASALRVGDSLFAVGAYSKAVQLYQKAEHSEAKIALAYDAMGNESKALNYYKRATLKEKSPTLMQYNYGKMLLKAQQLKSADSMFQLLTAKHPEHAEFVYQLGVLKQKEKDSTAIKLFVKAYELDQEHQNALYQIAKNAAENRDFKKAQRLIEIGLEKDHQSNRFVNLKAVVAFVNKNYHEALQSYQQLLQWGQSNIQLHEHLAVCYHRTNQFEKAIDQYQILINQYDDKNPGWHFNIAKSFEAVRRLNEAERHFQYSILLQDLPLDDSYIALASVYMKQKNYQKQLEALEKAVKENPENEKARYLFATAADNYFKDNTVVITYYQNYLDTFGADGIYAEYAKQRMSDLKKELHFQTEKNK